ncbi:hypothetical protein NPIL_294891 [Nephila pilipes]|uniref:Uncharacterized protein n=1 Tax=Nephila pilipes TaxID=299642 RepID=A0A8X6QXG0_NEPPI|nr:hypothetical protein NPIL_294891 [Nephila pilipes]
MFAKKYIRFINLYPQQTIIASRETNRTQGWAEAFRMFIFYLFLPFKKTFSVLYCVVFFISRLQSKTFRRKIWKPHSEIELQRLREQNCPSEWIAVQPPYVERSKTVEVDSKETRE